MDRTILVFGDDLGLIRLTEVILGRAGYTVLRADWQTKNAAPKPASADLIILEAFTPAQVAKTVRALRNARPGRRVPILLLATRDFAEDIRDAWDLGVDCLLVKPFLPAELLSYATRLLSPAAAGAAHATVPAAPSDRP